MIVLMILQCTADLPREIANLMSSRGFDVAVPAADRQSIDWLFL